MSAVAAGLKMSYAVPERSGDGRPCLQLVGEVEENFALRVRTDSITVQTGISQPDSFTARHDQIIAVRSAICPSLSGAAARECSRLQNIYRRAHAKKYGNDNHYVIFQGIDHLCSSFGIAAHR